MSCTQTGKLGAGGKHHSSALSFGFAKKTRTVIRGILAWPLTANFIREYIKLCVSFQHSPKEQPSRKLPGSARVSIRHHHVVRNPQKNLRDGANRRFLPLPIDAKILPTSPNKFVSLSPGLPQPVAKKKHTPTRCRNQRLTGVAEKPCGSPMS